MLTWSHEVSNNYFSTTEIKIGFKITIINCFFSQETMEVKATSEKAFQNLRKNKVLASFYLDYSRTHLK